MSGKKKLCYIVSDINKAVAFEWVAQKLDAEKFELSFILFLPSGKSHLENFLREKDIQVKSIKLNGKSAYFFAFISCISTLIKWNPAIVHCHLRKATLIGLIAAKLAGIKKRIYTRHHSTFHHEFYPKAVKWDHFANSLASDIVAISENVKEILEEKENVPPNKTHLIHHGFKLEDFSKVNEERIQKLRKKYLPRNFNAKVIGVIGRYIDWKGHKYIIEAAAEVIKTQPNTFFVFANASGPDKVKIKSLLQQNLPTENYTEIKFEEDLFALYQLFDIYVHVPVKENIEAFGQTYVEALAAGIPSIFTLSGIAKEFIEDGKNAMVVPFKDSKTIKNAILELMENENLRSKLIKNGKENVKQFNLNTFIHKLEMLYRHP